MAFLNACRLCLSEDRVLTDIFATSTNPKFSFNEIVTLLAQVPVESFDQMSTNICVLCASSCNEFLKFRELVQTSYNYQRMLLVDSKSPFAVNIKKEEVSDEIPAVECVLDAGSFKQESFFDDAVESDSEAESEEERIARKRPKNYNAARPRKHQCSTCNHKFATDIFLRRHEVIHSDLVTIIKGDFETRCIVCDAKFEDKSMLEKHIEKHRTALKKNKTIRCLRCDKTFASVGSLIKHLKRHEENKTHRCNVCKKTFAIGQDFIDHLNRHKGDPSLILNKPKEKRFVCDICGKYYLTLSKLRVHLKSHSGLKEYLCTECGKGFKTSSELKQHFTRHTGERKYHCSQCPAKFKTRGNLHAHRISHDPTKRHVCSICGSTFRHSHSLNKHHRIHTGERRYQCEFCEMRFFTSDHLKRHIRTHTGEKPYKCEYCPNAYAQNGDLNKHKRSHIGENTYKCTEADCTEAFRLQAELRDHMKFEAMSFKTACQLCLNEERDLFDIYSPSTKINLNFSEVVKLIAPACVKGQDFLSKKICSSCKKFCNDFLTFRECVVDSFNKQVQREELQNVCSVDVKQEVSEDSNPSVECNLSDKQKKTFKKESAKLPESYNGSDNASDSSEKVILKKPKDLSSGNLSCKTCGTKFAREIFLRRHEIVHSDLVSIIKRDFEKCCLICKDSFQDKTKLDSHMRDHRNSLKKQNDLKCIHCEKTLGSVSSLLKHLKRHEENKTHRCNVCKKTFAMSPDFIDHLNRHKGDPSLTKRKTKVKRFVCDICGKYYLTLWKLKVHLKTHSGLREYLCTECGKGFKTSSELKQHFTRHTGERKYHCSQCPAKFKTSGNLHAHRVSHDPRKRHVCSICGSTFTHGHSLTQHHLIHTGERKFQCEFCEMKCFSSNQLKRHVRTHTGEKPYKCEYCPNAYSQNSDLNKHKRLHIGENTYKCSVTDCNEAFRLQAELRDHMKVHYCNS